MKKIACVFAFCVVHLLAAQTITKLPMHTFQPNQMFASNNLPADPQFKLDTSNYDFSSRPFSIYNRTTMINDNYTGGGTVYNLKNSEFRFNYTGLGGPIDSLNPNGANNFQSVIVLGTINSLLRKL